MAESLRSLFNLRQEINGWKGGVNAAPSPDGFLTNDSQQQLDSYATQWRHHFEEHEFPYALQAVTRLQEQARLPRFRMDTALLRVEDIWRDFQSDCDDRFVEIIPADRGQFYDKGFGHEVDPTFPDATLEIKEAGTCYALGRHTASVFHLMRAVEHGLRALSVAVGVPCNKLPLEYQEWNTLIDGVQKHSANVIDTWGKSAELTNARQFFKRIISDLQAFKDDVRNVTMHTRANYDAPGALSVRNKTKDWFVVLATKVAEDQTESILDRSLFKP